MSGSRGWSVSHLWRNDDEMDTKKDDDRGLPRHARPTHTGHWQPAGPSRSSPRRAVIVRCACYAVVLFLLIYGLYSITSSFSASSIDERHTVRPPSTERTPKYDPPIHKIPPKEDTVTENTKAPSSEKPKERPKKETKGTITEATQKQQPILYKGPLKLPFLGQSLRAILDIGRRATDNRNVLFAAASLQSAASLLPMACQMAAERENYVHFALMGNSDIPIKELLKINGIDPSCLVITHDARPDHANELHEQRLALSSARALYHINAFMNPRAILIDASSTEEAYFLKGMRDEITSAKSTLIELPHDAATHLSWINKLDSSALASWNDVQFDILVHAPPVGSGNLKRLLKSLSRAYLSGVAPPHITIELPSVIDKVLGEYLTAFQWPPSKKSSTSQPKMMSLRHRISRRPVDKQESSARFLESFWPSNPQNCHVLVLSPHTEITPQFFHYVKYSLLHWRYSAKSRSQNWDQRIMGMSFSTPSTYLDGVKKFTPPPPVNSGITEVGTPFLWQAPNSDAVLIMGDKWVELHGYISHLWERQQSMLDTPQILGTKYAGEKHPAWLEYILQLSRLRGYFTLYPSQHTADSIVGVHTDLYDVPEENRGQAGQGRKQTQDSKTRTRGSADTTGETFDPGSQVDMMATLPKGGKLLTISELPWLSWNGKSTSPDEADVVAGDYTQEFRRQVGQCDSEALGLVPQRKADASDLFCKITKSVASNKGTDAKA